ncbi:MAG TPA: amidase family protein [Actinocrinis sp.]|nr:amidase family protein [Actinocrinis sp.]
MTSPTWIGKSAAQISAAVRAGDASPHDVVSEHLERIARLDPRLSAFRRVRHEEALAEADLVAARADLAELPLAGVPVAVKDNVEVAGEQKRNGTMAGPEEPSASDHPVVQRLREAGAVVVGVTNVPELCLFPMSDSPFGIARNPWNRERTPGGSSGGSAAAVAAALVPLAHGNDGLGSIRIPASCCGLVGIKPGRGVVPVSLDGAEQWFGLVENGPLATTVQDAATALSVMAADPSYADVGEPGPLRIGVSVRAAQAGFPIEGPCAQAAVSLVSVLTGLGHNVARHTRRYPAWLGPATAGTWYTAAYLDAAELDRARLGRAVRQMTEFGRVLNTLRMSGAKGRARWRDGAAGEFFGDIDVLMLPALATAPPEARRWGEHGALRASMVSTRAASLFGAWNVAGWPAMSIPGGTHPDTGTPLGVQLVARPGRERTLLALAAQIEKARPWHRHAPDYRDSTT